MPETWIRPDSVPYPSVWSRVDGKQALANGKIPKFRIQDPPEEILEEMIHHTILYYLRDEPFAAHLGILNDQEAIGELKNIWSMVFEGRCVLLALLDNPEDFPGQNLPKIAGVNWTLPIDKNWAIPQVKSRKLVSWLGILKDLSERADVFEKYNVEAYMGALGLSVDPTYRAQGLGEAIVKARFPLGKAVGLPLTSTVFTSAGAQAIGKKCGMVLLATINPEDYEKDGVAVFKGIKAKCIQYVAVPIK